MTDVAAVDAWLPQTQCTRCGYDDCRAYAVAITNQSEHIDRCPPGGEATLRALAGLLGLPSPRGIAAGLEPFDGFHVAHIVEEECIGCTKCIDACPVDAIVGSGKALHTVLDFLCTGCELCIPPCPVDCIRLEAAPDRAPRSGEWPAFPADAAMRFRLARERKRQRHAATDKAAGTGSAGASKPDDASMDKQILQAVERRRKQREKWQRPGSEYWMRKP